MRNLGSISPISSETIARCGDLFVILALEGRHKKSWEYTNKASHVRELSVCQRPCLSKMEDPPGKTLNINLGLPHMQAYSHTCMHTHT